MTSKSPPATKEDILYLKHTVMAALAVFTIVIVAAALLLR